MTLSTSPTSVGSSADVGSSNSSTFGLHRQRPGDRHALPLPARQPRRVLVALLAQADLVEVLLGRRDRLFLVHPLDVHRRLDEVADDGQMREEVELLEHHPGPQSGSAGSARGGASRGASQRVGLDDRRRRCRPPRRVGSSRKFRHRRSVLLPDPDRPRMATVSPGRPRAYATQDVVVVEVLLDRRRLDDRLGAGLVRCAGRRGRVDDVVDARAPMRRVVARSDRGRRSPSAARGGPGTGRTGSSGPST